MARLQKTKWYGVVQEGKLVLDNKGVFYQFLKGIPDGTRIEITLEKEGRDVTQQQWRYLYSCVYAPFAEHFGWTVDEVDQYFKKKFCQANLIQLPQGLSLSKTSFDRQWLSTYIDFCCLVAAKEGVVVQDPNPNWQERKTV